MTIAEVLAQVARSVLLALEFLARLFARPIRWVQLELAI